MDNPKVSIIIPIYNVAEYLVNCIESAISQTYGNIEIILVNDGSTDNSLSICNAYAAQNERIVVLDKENGGLSSARNAGMAKATGDFVFHLDGDDSIPHDAIEILVEEQQKTYADLVFGDYNDIYPDETRYVQRKTYNDKMQFIESISSDLAFPHYVWGILINKRIYDTYNIAPEHGVNVGEDLQVFPQLIWYAGKISKIDKSVYDYNHTNIQSLTAGVSYSRMIQDVKSIDIFSSFLKRMTLESANDKLMISKIRMIATYIVMASFNCTDQQYKNLHYLASDHSLKAAKKSLSIRKRVLLHIKNHSLARKFNKVFNFAVALLTKIKPSVNPNVRKS